MEDPLGAIKMQRESMISNEMMKIWEDFWSAFSAPLG